MSYNINKQRELSICKSINKILDQYLGGQTVGTKHAKNIISREDYDKYFEDGKKTIYDAKKQFLKPKNLSQLLNDIKWVNVNLYNSKLEYKNEVRNILIDILDDRIAFDKDNNSTNSIKESIDIIKFDDYMITESIDDVEIFVVDEIESLVQIESVEVETIEHGTVKVETNVQVEKTQTFNIKKFNEL